MSLSVSLVFQASRFCIRASQTGEALARWAGVSKALMLSPAVTSYKSGWVGGGGGGATKLEKPGPKTFLVHPPPPDRVKPSVILLRGGNFLRPAPLSLYFTAFLTCVGAYNTMHFALDTFEIIFS